MRRGAAPDPAKGNDSLWKPLHKTINGNRNLMLWSKTADSCFIFMARITRILIYKQKCAAAPSEESQGRRIP